MLKIAGIGMILSSFITLGVMAKHRLFLRQKLLTQMIECIEIMQRELNFNQIKTRDLIFKLFKHSKPPLKTIFARICENEVFEFDECFENYFRKYGVEIGFSKEDIETIVLISGVLGKFDCYEQIKTLEFIKNELENNKKDAKSKFLKEGNILRTTIFMIGVFIVVILF